MLLRRGERDGGIQAGDADYGTVEVVEGFFVDDGGDFSGMRYGLENESARLNLNILLVADKTPGGGRKLL